MRDAVRCVAALASAAMLCVAAGCASSGHSTGAAERSALARRDLVDRIGDGDSRTDRRDPEASPAAAQAPAPNPDRALSLPLEHAVMLALRGNRDLHVQRLQPEIVGTFGRIERGVYNPTLFANVQHGEQRASQVDRGTRQRFDVEAADTRSELGVRQRLPSGTDIETRVAHARDDSDRAPEQQEARVELTVTQSLLRGNGPAVNLASVRQADLETRASLHQLRGFLTALLAETETTYWQLVLARERIAIFERGVEVAQQYEDEVEQRIEVGSLPQAEAAAARAEVARRQQQLIDAERDLEARRLRLARLINTRPDGGLSQRIEPTSDPQVDPEPLDDLEDRVALADRMRADLAEARVRLEQNELETVVTSNGVLPRLDFFIAVAKTGFARSFSDAFRNLSTNTYEVTAGMSFEHLLGNEIARARDRQAELSRQQAELAVDNLQQLVRLDVRLAANEVERARQQIEAAASTRQAQEQVVETEQHRFEVGTSTSLQVARAQRDLLEAQIAEVEAVVDYRVALVQLWAAEGSLPERRGISTVNDGAS